MRGFTILILVSAGAAFAQPPCTVERPTATLQIPHVSGDPALSADPSSAAWRGAGSVGVTAISKDCSKQIDYPALRTDVRSFWTDTHLYLLFSCPYTELNLFLPAQGGGPRNKLWDRDVVEMFLGDDWTNIRHYREFEIAPTGDWIDLAIDLDHESYDQSWRSGWNTAARIDKEAHVWYAAARIPLRAVSTSPVKAGTKWRANLYRIEGLGPDSGRKFMCWQPTCVVNRDPNHVPENFGTLVFAGGATPLADGRRAFEQRCGGCHGADGMGGERAPAIGSEDRSRLRSDEAVRNLIHEGIPDAGMPAFRLTEPELSQIVAFVRSRVTPSRDSPPPGDAGAGQAYFFGAGGCAQCHMMNGHGGVTGPDLSDAGSQLTLAEMEQSMLKPAARRKPGYEVATVRLNSGPPVRGFVRNESLYDLQVQGFDSRLYLLRRGEVAAIERETASYMPALHAGETELLYNLIAYLAHPPTGQPVSGQPELPGAISWDRIAHPQSGDWPTYHGQLGGNRFSTLDRITPRNIAQLAPRWIFPIPNARHAEVTPVVVDGVMYVTNVNAAWALDAATGREIWHYERPRSKGLSGDAAGGINRGVALLGDRVFMVTDNAHLIALHRLTGAILWDTQMADSNQNYGATSAPLVVKDMVISGTSGGDEGIRGFVSAYSAATGERVWRFWSVPGPGDPAAATWGGRAIEHGCASTWLTGTYDLETDTVLWPIGNPCPDFNGDERRGDNLYADCVVALDPQTGALKWHYQFTPHDLHDWDATETPMVVDALYGGSPRKLLLQGNRNGFFYVLDRTNGQFLNASPFVHALTWASGISQEKGSAGRPVMLPGSEPTLAGARACPSMDGATNWMSTAFNPDKRMFYLMALEKCNVFTKSSAVWKAGESYYGGGTREDHSESPRQYLRALNLDTGKIAWEVPQTGEAESWGGLLATSSGLLFYCDDSGAFAAVDAGTGAPLWHMQLNTAWKASPMTYIAKGNQYVAVAAGGNVVAFGL